jgi:Exonuclease III
MRIISYNVNGIRAAFTKDLLGWLKVADPDIICIQESKAGNDQIDIESLEKNRLQKLLAFCTTKRLFRSWDRL